MKKYLILFILLFLHNAAYADVQLSCNDHISVWSEAWFNKDLHQTINELTQSGYILEDQYTIGYDNLIYSEMVNPYLEPYGIGIESTSNGENIKIYLVYDAEQYNSITQILNRIDSDGLLNKEMWFDSQASYLLHLISSESDDFEVIIEKTNWNKNFKPIYSELISIQKVGFLPTTNGKTMKLVMVANDESPDGMALIKGSIESYSPGDLTATYSGMLSWAIGQDRLFIISPGFYVPIESTSVKVSVIEYRIESDIPTIVLDEPLVISFDVK